MNSTTHSLDCQTPMSWAEERRQFARLLRMMSMAAARAVMPRCRNWFTRLLNEPASMASSNRHLDAMGVGVGIGNRLKHFEDKRKYAVAKTGRGGVKS